MSKGPQDRWEMVKCILCKGSGKRGDRNCTLCNGKKQIKVLR